MENKENKKNHKVTDSEEYNIEKPQELTQPQYNSTTKNRQGGELPAVENLNQTEGLKNELKDAKKDNNHPATPINDESLHGGGPKTELGNGPRDQDEDEDEKIIRT
jgi:hypothetical protein